VDRVQTFLQSIRGVSEDKIDQIFSELEELNLRSYIPDLCRAIAQSRLGQRELDILIEVSIFMHQRYEDFAGELIDALSKEAKASSIKEMTKLRNLLRALSELYLKGLFEEYKKVFEVLTKFIAVSP